MIRKAVPFVSPQKIFAASPNIEYRKQEITSFVKQEEIDSDLAN